MRIGVIAAVRVDNGHAVRQRLLALVVIGNAQIDAEAFAVFRLLDGGDAAVNGDDELRALLVERADGELVQPIALLQPAGDVGDAAVEPALPAEKVRQQRGRGDAVHIVVAEHDDLLAAL